MNTDNGKDNLIILSVMCIVILFLFLPYLVRDDQTQASNNTYDSAKVITSSAKAYEQEVEEAASQLRAKRKAEGEETGAEATDAYVNDTDGTLELQTILHERMAVASQDDTPWNRVDISYGGKVEAQDDELPFGRLEVPKVGIDQEIFTGIGIAESGILSNGNEARMTNPVTWRFNQVLGGDNFVLLSHVDTGSGDLSKWFTPLLTGEDGKIVDSLDDILIQMGDEIIITEYETGVTWVFRMTDSGRTESDDPEDQLQDARPYLDRTPGFPAVTLQGCLFGNPGHKFFITGSLREMRRGDQVFKVE